VHQPYKMDNIDMVLPTLTPAGYVWPCGPDGKGNPCAAGFLPTGTQRIDTQRRTQPEFWTHQRDYGKPIRSMMPLQVDVAKAREPRRPVPSAYHMG